MRTVIGLSGYAGAGKDSVADILCEDFGFTKLAFADPMRAMAKAIDPIVGFTENGPIHYHEAIEVLGYRKAKDEFPEVRRFLQRLGTEGGREILGDDVWVNAAMLQAIKFDRVAFSDVRFANEVLAIQDVAGTVVRITRPGFGPANDHVSETGLDGFRFGYNLLNESSLEELRGEVHRMMRVRFPSIKAT